MNLIVTGSSGFVGSHLGRALSKRLGDSDRAVGLDLADPRESSSCRHITADIRCAEELRKVADQFGPTDAVIHLAANAEVLTPWPEVAALLSSNIEGTYRVADIFNPRVLVFASSSSVYGNASLAHTSPDGAAIAPLCLYATSKATGEMIVRDWARETNRGAVTFRFGNVIGAGCRGLIPFLVEHVRRYPGGEVPARMRGGGKLVRDYVPVSYVVDLMLAAMQSPWAPGSATILNIGTGMSTSNGEVAAIVKSVAARNGFQLNCIFDDPPGPGEATEVVLDMDGTLERLEVPVPTREDVVAAIEASALSHLRRICASS